MTSQTVRYVTQAQNAHRHVLEGGPPAGELRPGHQGRPLADLLQQQGSRDRAEPPQEPGGSFRPLRDPHTPDSALERVRLRIQVPSRGHVRLQRQHIRL